VCVCVYVCTRCRGSCSLDALPCFTCAPGILDNQQWSFLQVALWTWKHLVFLPICNAKRALNMHVFIRWRNDFLHQTGQAINIWSHLSAPPMFLLDSTTQFATFTFFPLLTTFTSSAPLWKLLRIKTPLQSFHFQTHHWPNLFPPTPFFFSCTLPTFLGWPILFPDTLPHLSVCLWVKDRVLGWSRSYLHTLHRHHQEFLLIGSSQLCLPALNFTPIYLCCLATLCCHVPNTA
jgi:hypothetical protein